MSSGDPLAGLGPEPKAPSRRRVVLALLAVVAGGAGYASFLGAEDGPSYPEGWDPRIADLVTFVEKERDLRFEHPVPVDFMAPDEFEELLRSDEGDLSKQDRQDIDDAAAMLRALSLIGGDVDLFESVNDLQSEGTLAYYSWEDEHIRVRGRDLTPAVRATVAHELTHVLQDQHFDLGRIQDAADDEDADQEGDVLRGLAEGDANRIGSAYEESLSDEEREAIDAANEEDQETFDADSYPPVLIALFGAPYALGEQLTALILSAEGDKGLNAAFRSPPHFDKSLLDPLGYLDGEDGRALDVPALADDEEEVDHGGFGAFTLYLTLAQRLDEKRSLAAADAWDGDAFVAYRSADQVCVRVAVQGKNRKSTDAIVEALEEWVASGPTGSASVTRKGSTAVLQACDTKDQPAVTRDVDVAGLFALPSIRAQLGLLVLDGGGSIDQARCYANRTIETFGVEQLEAEELPPAEMERVQEIALECRSA